MNGTRNFSGSTGLSADKLELFEYLLEEEGIEDVAQTDIISPRDKTGLVPLSFAQQRLWFLDQLEPGSPAYNIAGALRMAGQLDVRALGRSLSEIVRRHESLHTSFVVVGGLPTQVIASASHLPLAFDDLTALPVAQREADLQRLMKEEVRKPFDLRESPLLRARLLRLAADEHLLLLTMHHIISDGWSIGIITRELTSLYDAYRKGEESPLDELATQYADYALWQREHLTGDLLEQQLSYWKKQLGGNPPVLELPTKRARSLQQTFRAAMQTFSLPEELCGKLKELARAEDGTLFMTLLAAFNILLWRYSGQLDLSVGSPIANRNRTETEPLIGFFVNTLVLRTRLNGGMTFRELLRRVKETCLGAYAHQEVPFERLVEELQPERTISHTPLVRVMFVLQNAPMPPIELSGLKLTLTETDNEVAKFDLMLEMTETDDGLRGLWQYNTDLFDDRLITRMASNFQALLEGIAANSVARLSELPFLTAGESHQLLVDWNRTDSDYPKDACLHELFEQQVEKTPHDVALIFEGTRLTYSDLNQRANQLARYLIGLGVGPEACVGIAMERSPEMVIAVLGIIKAGGSYVPLDPAHPSERLSFMIEDAGLALILSQAHLVERLPQQGARVLCLDTDWKQVAREETANLSPMVTPQSLIYVIYTSGTTGKPKGVAAHHRGIVNCLLSAKAPAPVKAQDRMLFKCSLSFDPSVWELFTPLLIGASLVIARPGAEHDAAYIARTTIDQEITVLHFVPSMLAVFLEEPSMAEIVSLRWVVCGGEAMPVQTMERFQARCSVPLQNFYGPTETSIGSTLWLCDPPAADKVVPIGRPISNTQAYVLDEEGNLAPIEVAGELYLGGDGVTRGYLNRPDLTAENFLPDPYSGKPGARLYRTGDLVRYLPDGDLEFLGRSDHQVKIRGCRVELEEIAAVLGEHAAVRECLVLAREDVPGDQRLIAYLTAAPESAPESTELRSHLREKLPEYMIPSVFVTLAEFPLTVNGKVDREKLPAPDPPTQKRARSYLAPRTPTEQALASIIGGVLGIEQVGVYDNFFDLGGHSLLATQVVTRVRETFQVNLQLKRFFQSPVIAELAAWVDPLRQVGPTRAAWPIARAFRQRVLPLSFAQQRLWFLDQLEPGNPIYNIPSALRLRGPLDADALERTLGEIVRRHESLRTIFREEDGVPVQVIQPNQAIALPVLNLVELPEADKETEVDRLGSAEARKPFDLARGPLLRAALLRLGSEDHVLLFTMHHIISDGWSMGILVREAKAIYAAYAQQRESPLPELALQYADYAVWQRSYLQGDVLDAQLAYWKSQLDLMPHVLELPADRPRPRELSFRGGALNVELSGALTEELRSLCRREGVTLYMILLAAFQTLLYRYTGEEDIVVGSPIANRQNSEIEPLIGFFVNTLVLRTDLSGDPTFRELLGRVQEITMGAYEHQDIPFEMLVEELQPERNLSFAPLFQILFVLQNAPRDELSLANLALSHMEVSSGATHFDLTLQLEETAQGMTGVIEYSTDLFDQETMQRMFGHLRTLLAGVVANPEERICALPLLTAAEKDRLLVQWNDTSTAIGAEECIQDLVAQQAVRTPNALALTFGAQQLSYGELNRRANRLAHRLQTLGVGPDVVVGIMMHRSVEMMVSVLAVLKAGGAYLFLDSTDPAERLAFVLRDSMAPVVLTQRDLEARLFAADCAHILCVDTEWPEIVPGAEDKPVSRTTPDNLAYLTYTSGSTGQPKAVAMHHRPLVNLVRFQIQSSGVASPPRTLQFASLSFDVSFQEVFSTWCAGGTLVLITEDARRDSRELWRTVADEAIERLFLPFVALQSMAEVAGSEKLLPPSLRQIITAGEQLKITKEMRALFARLPQCSLDNHYGPSETHLATCLRMGGPASEWPRLPAIGRPIPNAQVFVLNPELQLTPVGVVGELYIGGAGLAREYFNRPDLTALRFIPHPFGPPGARLYRTGDLVRYRNDGSLEFVGRIDGQVKVRGFRIEVGEIESVLKQHSAVKQVAVVPIEGEAGAKRLVAYVVATPGAAPTSEQLRGYLREKLPEYLVPATFLLLGSLPLLRSGKVDRDALRGRVEARAENVDGYVAPKTPTEEILAGLWADVLKRERVGLNDNFFDLGGHSLLATQLMSRVRDAFQVEVPLRSLFDSPNLAHLAQAIEANMRSRQGLPVPAIRRGPRNGFLPLSFAQQRLWFINQLQQNSSVYHLAAALHLSGPLDGKALEQSLGEILRRHDVLRSSFTVMNGQPVQVIAPHSDFTLATVDLSSQPRAEREAELQRLMKEEVCKPFKLSESPLLRARLLRLAPNEHVLQVTMHHIVSDGWSSGVMIRELAALYEAFIKGKSSPLDELRIQYADYALWQREHLTGGFLAEQLSYWKEHLAGAPATLELPRRKARPVMQGFRGAIERFELSPELTAQLKRLSGGEGVTLFMTLLAAFKVLLWRYSGQSDIVVGSPIANRNRAETEPLIGFFVNTLVLRTRLAGSLSFRELLGRVREVCLGAYAHQEVPFEKLVEELQPERSLSHTPLVQVMFALQNAPMPPLALARLRLSVMDVPLETAKFDLALSLQETSEGLFGDLEYSSDLFDSVAARQMLDHYRCLLASILTNADAPLSELTLLTDAERRRILVEWNDTAFENETAICAHEAFEQQVDLTPEVVAVIQGPEQITYRELNLRANQLAHHLHGLGVGPEKLVGICIERSIEYLIGILAVAKTGGAYVPLDPTYPAERLALILEDCRALALLTNEGLRGKFAQGETTMVLLDHDRETIESQPGGNLISPVTTGNLAYVIYTSGSTGQPKGVQITHSSLMNLVRWHQHTSALAPGDRTALLAGMAFDASIFELWPNLTAGVTIHLPDEETRLSPVKLRDWIVAQKITVCFVPTPLAELILPLKWPPAASLRILHTGGDKLHDCPDTVPFQVVNNYGPTETTVIATFAWVSSEDRSEGESPSIGRPIDNVQVYILDRNLEPVPARVPGELYVGGAALARGYSNQSDLTAEMFLPDPFSTSPGGRLYRTGDMARYRADGRIEFLGRHDQQIKIRGHRIELGEIEVVLNKHPEVRESVVVCGEDGHGEKRLTAYLVLKETGQLSVDELRASLVEKLPSFMLPPALVVLERLPLNANGKVDREALPAADLSLLSLGAPYVAPASEMERTISGVWQELLGLERVGIHDNFFDLGGHSLLMIQMQSRLQEVFQRDIAIIDLFHFPTVRELARHLGAEHQQSQAPNVSAHKARAAARRESVKGRVRRRQQQPTT